MKSRLGIELSHAGMVTDLVKPADKIISELTSVKVDMWHMVSGISGEAGELLDAIKKHVAYGKPLNVSNVIEELGDLEFYMEGLRQALGLSREEILEENIRKLGKRYPAGEYKDKDAIERKDKKESVAEQMKILGHDTGSSV